MKLARSILMAGSLALLATEAGAQVITSYTYDSIGRLTKSASTTGKTAKYSYDLADNRTDKVDATTTFIGPGAGLKYVWGFQSGKDHVDLSAFNFGITGSQVLVQAVNVDQPGTANDYCYFYLTNAGGVDNYVIFMGQLSSQLQASDFVMQ